MLHSHTKNKYTISISRSIVIVRYFQQNKMWNKWNRKMASCAQKNKYIVLFLFLSFLLFYTHIVSNIDSIYYYFCSNEQHGSIMKAYMHLNWMRSKVNRNKTVTHNSCIWYAYLVRFVFMYENCGLRMRSLNCYLLFNWEENRYSRNCKEARAQCLSLNKRKGKWFVAIKRKSLYGAHSLSTCSAEYVEWVRMFENEQHQNLRHIRIPLMITEATVSGRNEQMCVCVCVWLVW